MNMDIKPTYKLNDHIELSANLTRFARKNGQDSNPSYSIGYCSIEFLKSQGTFFDATPMLLEPNQPIEKITIDQECEMKGKFAIQTKETQTGLSEQEKDEFLKMASEDAPQADRLTVAAIISHCGIRKVRHEHNERLDTLAKDNGLSRNEAIWLANCNNDKGIIFEEGCWCTSGAKFYDAPNEAELNKLVDDGLLTLDNGKYTTTDLGRECVEDAYL